MVLIAFLVSSLIGQMQAEAAPAGSEGREIRETRESASTVLRQTRRLTLFSTPAEIPGSPATSFRWSQKEASEVSGRKSPKLAGLMSAIVPGAGQFYARSYVKAALFLGVEVGSWVAYAHFRQRGIDLRAEYEAFADANWVEERYWSWLAQVSGCSVQDLNCLKEYERQNFTHHLPDERDLEYYENIGKYDQFNSGWIDSESGLGMRRDSAYREQYTLMRKDSNDQFRRATNMTAIVLLNHVLSAFDAAWTSSRHNRTLRASLRIVPMRYQYQALPALNMRLTW
jgi:hypothetical protein